MNKEKLDRANQIIGRLNTLNTNLKNLEFFNNSGVSQSCFSIEHYSESSNVLIPTKSIDVVLFILKRDCKALVKELENEFDNL